MMGGFGYVRRYFDPTETEDNKDGEWMIKAVWGEQHNPTEKRFYSPDWLEEIIKENQKNKDKLQKIIDKLTKWYDDCNPNNSIGYGIRFEIEEILRDEP